MVSLWCIFAVKLIYIHTNDILNKENSRKSGSVGYVLYVLHIRFRFMTIAEYFLAVCFCFFLL